MRYLDTGGQISSACELFHVSRSSIQRWRARQSQLGSLSPSLRANLPYKLKDDVLQSYMNEHPDAYLSEIAAHFGATESGVWRALSRLKITRKKKDHALRRTRRSKAPDISSRTQKTSRSSLCLY